MHALNYIMCFYALQFSVIVCNQAVVRAYRLRLSVLNKLLTYLLTYSKGNAVEIKKWVKYKVTKRNICSKTQKALRLSKHGYAP